MQKYAGPTRPAGGAGGGAPRVRGGVRGGGSPLALSRGVWGAAAPQFWADEILKAADGSLSAEETGPARA